MKAGIVGAGIMGRLLAFNLLNADWDVTLFDQNQRDDELAITPQQASISKRNNPTYSCSMTAAGLLTPISELDKAEELIFRLGRAALNIHWPTIVSQLPDPIYFQRTGTLTLAHPNDHAEMAHFIDKISHQLCSYSQQFYQKITQAEIKQLEPEVTKFQQGYYFPEEGHIDTQALLCALGKYLNERQIKWHSETFVEKIEPFKVVLNNVVEKFDIVFDCRGLGAKSFFTDLRGVRGELIWLYAPEVNISRSIRFLHPRYSLYIVPRPQNIYLVGASEIESEDFSEITLKTSLELLTATYYVHPGFAEARVIQSMTHCRPTLSDHLPKIKSTQGLVAINGLYRHGYLIAPTIANDVLQWLEKGVTGIGYPEMWEV